MSDHTLSHTFSPQRCGFDVPILIALKFRDRDPLDRTNYRDVMQQKINFPSAISAIYIRLEQKTRSTCCSLSDAHVYLQGDLNFHSKTPRTLLDRGTEYLGPGQCSSKCDAARRPWLASASPLEVSRPVSGIRRQR